MSIDDPMLFAGCERILARAAAFNWRATPGPVTYYGGVRLVIETFYE